MSKFLSIDQIDDSLQGLAKLHPFFGMSFLAFKTADLPVGSAKSLNFSKAIQRVLERHYKPASEYKGFYNPFQTSDKSNRWTAARYGSTTLQRITADTFGDALIHEKTSSFWGWHLKYVERLEKHLGPNRIPAFHLAAWLNRDSEWPDAITPEGIIERLISEFLFTHEELTSLFDLTIPWSLPEGWISTRPFSENELLARIGYPPGVAPPGDAALKELELYDVGPSRQLIFEPAPRLNLITGNNSLGKTFLLDCIWWCLTGEWIEYYASPREGVARSRPRIHFSLSSVREHYQAFNALFNWDRQRWTVTPPYPRSPGLVIYARFDGSFAIWDPARTQVIEEHSRIRNEARVFLSRKQVWEGTQERGLGPDEKWICNGILRDWISWQTGGERYRSQYAAFLSSLIDLSPSKEELLQPGEPKRLLLDSRPVPTLKMPYGETPILNASAAVQRIVALTYVLVWSWHEHLANSQIIRREPRRHLVLIVDEVEAHLHPVWQRLIVPSIMRVVSNISPTLQTQIYVATHSPLVLASTEGGFDSGQDALHHLHLRGDTVEVEQLPFVKRGRADSWLMSDAFGLGQPRSLPAEEAINDAKRLQLSPGPDKSAVHEVNSRLVHFLAPDDEFWPRWKYFAEKHGVAK